MKNWKFYLWGVIILIIGISCFYLIKREKVQKEEWITAKGISFYLQGKIKRAEAFFKRSSHPYSYFYLGRIYLENKKYSEAIPLFEKFLNFTEDWKGHFYLGIAYYNAGRLDKAINHLIKAKELAQEQKNPYLVLGLLYGAMGEHKKAIEILKDAFIKGILEGELLYVLGVEYIRDGQKEKAKEILKYLSFLSPSFAKKLGEEIDGAE